MTRDEKSKAMVMSVKHKQRTQYTLRRRKKTPEARRTQLLNHLGLALQLEHATIPPYLFALYSIRDPYVQNFEAARVLRSIVVEEMLHMVLVANLINAILPKKILHGVPNQLKLDRDGFIPKYPTPLPGSIGPFIVELRPFSREAIVTFLKIERPAEIDVPPIDISTKDVRYASIGQFYAVIKQELDDFCQDFGESELFHGNVDRQVNSQHYYNGGGEVIVVCDHSSAHRAIKIIVDEGEGFNLSIFSGDHEQFHELRDLAHYYKFKELKEGRRFLATDSPTNEPSGDSFPVFFGADAIEPANADMDLSDYPEIKLRVVSFNKLYRELLRVCERAFNGRPSEFEAALPLMHAIKDEMTAIMRIPVGDSGFTVGPTFEFISI